MNRNGVVDVFAEDQDHAHEDFIRAVISRFNRENQLNLQVRIRNGRGGHGRVISELKLFQKAVLTQTSGSEGIPDIVIVAIDANCRRFAKAKKEIEDYLIPEFITRTIVACPDPQIEKWYLADSESFCDVIGQQPLV